jgi:L-ribulokinase
MAIAGACIIGLDYGTESARGVLIDAVTGKQLAACAEPYRHGVMTRSLPDGTPLARGWALQNAADYTEVAETILTTLGRGRTIAGIGLDFTASSPMPATREGQPLSAFHPDAPHAYVKLWKHHAAQPFADKINRAGGRFLDNFGGRLSGEWLLAKAAQLAEEAPDLWARTDKFIEAGDWLVWQLTGSEARSLGFAAYKAQYSREDGYPAHIVPSLGERLAEPLRIGSPAGGLRPSWRARTGIEGPAIVAVAVIDSHAALPAIGAVSPGCLVAALGTSAVSLLLSDEHRPLPPGIEGMAFDGSIRDLWCYEAGQAGFGDILAWFAKTFPHGADLAESFRYYNAEAAKLTAGASRLLALDWWNGNRVPYADSDLSGLLVGLTVETSAVQIYRALLESLCFGLRTVHDLLVAGGLTMERVVLTSGLAEGNPLLVQTIADVLGRAVEVPAIANPTAVGAAIHGAVAAGVVDGYADGARRYGARTSTAFQPNAAATATYDKLYRVYRGLGEGTLPPREAMHRLGQIG